MNLIFKKPRGTQDILPQNTFKWRYVEQTLLNTALKYGFKEIRIPTFEHTDLLCRSVGDTSDIVEKEMYTFEDKSSRLITLRPEGTAGTIRAVLENSLLNQGLPQKLMYILSCFRYEKPDANRLREFHQFGVELLGSSSPQADFEVISMAIEMFKNVGIENISLNINSIGCPTCRKEYKQSLINYMTSHKNNLCDVCKDRLLKNPMRILDCKEESCKNIAKNAPVILDFLCNDCKIHFSALQKYLLEGKIQYTINTQIVRGLDYYTKTVFELIANVNNSSITICGGGRYDNLVSELGGPETPAFGFGIGLERLIAILTEQQKIKISDEPCDIYIIALDEPSKLYAINLIKKFRQQGKVIETDLMGRSLKAQMKYANKIGAKHTLVIGNDEIKKRKANLKNMETSEITEIDI